MAQNHGNFPTLKVVHEHTLALARLTERIGGIGRIVKWTRHVETGLWAGTGANGALITRLTYPKHTPPHHEAVNKNQ